MFYNTKVEPLFETTSKKWRKNMFYNIFLDLNQEMRGGYRTGGRASGRGVSDYEGSCGHAKPTMQL